MKSVIRYIGIVFVILVLVYQSGCSRNDQQQAEVENEQKGRIEQVTDEVADKAVEKIRTPLDKARSTRELGEERTEAMDKALKQ